MPNYTNKIKSKEELAPLLAELKEKDKTIVFTNGCFDIIHTGHIRYLHQAKALGDILVIGVNTDASVKMFKGDKRPIVSENDRAEVLAALEMVDYVVKFNERTPAELISALRPHIHVKGGDYSPEDLPEAEVLKAYGGRVEIVPLVEGKGTTGIVERILTVYKNTSMSNYK